MKKTKNLLLALAVFGAIYAPSLPAYASERIKDLTTIAGVRANQLAGYGLVVGLDGTGDQTTQTPFTVQSLVTMMSNMGVSLPPGTNLQLKNVASVMVTATLPPFVRPGQQIDVTVSSVGNAKSLRGGTLIMTPLKAANGEVYAIAQGNMVVGGAGASSGGAAKSINHLSAGRIPGGAIVERGVEQMMAGDTIHLELRDNDFGTASKVVSAINKAFGLGTATASDSRLIEVRTPDESSARVAFIGKLENLEVTPDAQMAKVVINSRTGSVVMNRRVALQEASIAHGSLSVTIEKDPAVSQPAPFSDGLTALVERTSIDIKEQGGSIKHVRSSATLADVVKSLNALGATPMDLVSILQALKTSGALRAELEII